ncbi:MAG: aminoglycoside 3-N-acetyltransferase, partial [Candidatus Latescibacterota bacterium]
MHTRASLLADLRTLGVEVGSTLFVHSSLRSVGAIAGGAAAVIAALEDALGQEGLLLLPSFNLVPRDK